MLRTVVVLFVVVGLVFVVALLLGFLVLGPGLLMDAEPATEEFRMPTENPETLEPNQKTPTATFTLAPTYTEVSTPTPTETPAPVPILTDEGESWNDLIKVMQEYDPDIGYDLGLCLDLPPSVVTKIVYEETEEGEEYTCVTRVYFTPPEDRTHSLWLVSYDFIVREAPENFEKPERFIGDSYMLALGLEEYNLDSGFFTQEEAETFQEELVWPVEGVWGISEELYDFLFMRLEIPQVLDLP